jgi:hypothetical protein
VNSKNFQTLRKATNLTRESLRTLKLTDVHNLKDEIEEKCKRNYFIHTINLFETSKNNNNMIEFLENMQHNLAFMNIFEKGDIVKFERTLYSHHAVLTDDHTMVVVHRYGEPEKPGSFLQSLLSVSGVPSPKAKVVKDLLVEVAGYRRVFNGNDEYDKKAPPRFQIK